MKNKNILLLIISFAFVFVLCSCGNSYKAPVKYTDLNIYGLEDCSYMTSKLYKGEAQKAPLLDDLKSTNSIFDGENGELGTFVILGSCNKKEINNYPAYGLTGNSVEIQYKQVWNPLNSKYSYAYKESNTLNNHVIPTIGYGGLLIEKSFDWGKTWVYTNICMSNIDNEIVRFTPDAEDILNGCLYRFIAFAEVKEFVRTEKQGFIFETDKAIYNYYDIMQVAYAYIASDNPNVAFYCGTYNINAYDIGHTLYEQYGKKLPEISESYKRNEIECGKEKLLDISINGPLKQTTWNNYDTYVYNGSTDITINIKQDSSNLSNDKKWTTEKYERTNLYGCKVSEFTEDKGFLVTKSLDGGKTFELDYYSTIDNNNDITFTPNRIDYQKGCIYRIYYIVNGAYCYESKTDGWWFWEKTYNSYDYYSWVEYSEFYVITEREGLSSETDME